MAKKTKAQKIAASERKERVITTQPSQSATKTVLTESAQDKEVKKYFFVDLRKSLVVVAVILGIEIALFFFQ